MRIGVPKEIKTHEYRVGMTPAAVREAVHHGHEVVVQAGAGNGNGIGCDDAAYIAAGAQALPTAASVFDSAQMIVKVKEPQPAECAMLRQGQLLWRFKSAPWRCKRSTAASVCCSAACRASRRGAWW